MLQNIFLKKISGRNNIGEVQFLVSDYQKNRCVLRMSRRIFTFNTILGVYIMGNTWELQCILFFDINN